MRIHGAQLRQHALDRLLGLLEAVSRSPRAAVPASTGTSPRTRTRCYVLCQGERSGVLTGLETRLQEHHLRNPSKVATARRQRRKRKAAATKSTTRLLRAPGTCGRNTAQRAPTAAETRSRRCEASGQSGLQRRPLPWRPRWHRRTSQTSSPGSTQQTCAGQRPPFPPGVSGHPPAPTLV